jgi:predicted AAA+ superfamily ATPase
MTSTALAKAGGKSSQSRETRQKSDRTTRGSTVAQSTKMEYRRRTVEFHPEIDEVIHDLQAELRLRNQTDVIQKAIQVLSILVGEKGEKRPKVFLSTENGKLQQLIIV